MFQTTNQFIDVEESTIVSKSTTARIQAMPWHAVAHWLPSGQFLHLAGGVTNSDCRISRGIPNVLWNYGTMEV